jgi:8-oxo-dGTP diphosphatase
MAFAVTVDLALFTTRGDELCVLVVQRANDPYRGRWALPGGFVEEDERLIDAARRELAEETGLAELDTELVQLGAYGDPGRDPRGRVVSVVYVAFDDVLPDPVADSDAADARWRPVDELLAHPMELAFDHGRIIGDARARIFGS